MKEYVQKLRKLKPKVEYTFMEDMIAKRDNSDKIRRCQVVALKLLIYLKKNNIQWEQFAHENDIPNEQLYSLLNAKHDVSEEVMKKCAELIGLESMNDSKQDKAMTECLAK